MVSNLKEEFEIIAPVSGRVMDLSEVPNDIFSKKLAGDGVAIDPSDSVIVAPTDGKLSLIFDSNHAFIMKLDNKIEIVVHIGIDTVELCGYGFERIAKQGQTVKKGDPVIKIDRKAINEKGYSLITPVVIANDELLKNIEYNVDFNACAGKDTIIKCKI